MNTLHIKIGSMLIPLVMLFSVDLNADQIPNSAALQKEAMAQMHHKLHDDQAPYKANEAQALKELNEMTIREDVRIEDVNIKVDELMAAKKQIMRLRYGHLIEMRTVLTDDQKIGYDKGVLSRSAVK